MAANFADWLASQGSAPAGGKSFAEFISGSAPASPPSFSQWAAGQPPASRPSAPATSAPTATQGATPLRGIFDVTNNQQTFRGDRYEGGGENGPQFVAGDAIPTAPRFDDPAIQQLVDSGVISYGPRRESTGGVPDNGGEGYATTTLPYSVDIGKLPSTRYGPISQVMRYDTPSGQGEGGFKLRNPNAKYFDPNYGWITPRANTIDPSSQTNGYDMIGPIVMSAVLGAAGAGMFGPVAAGQSMGYGAANALTSGLRNGGSGLAGSAAGFLGGLTGIPGAGAAASIGAGMLQGKKPTINPVGAGVSFAQWLAQSAGR